MKKYLSTLEDERTARSMEEYLGAFTESMKMILHENPVELVGYVTMLAAKTALRLKAAKPSLREYEIAGRLQNISRNIRLTSILNDLTPEEKRIIKLQPHNHNHKNHRAPSRTKKRTAMLRPASGRKSAAKGLPAGRA